MNDPSPQPLPQWSWVLAMLFFPCGVFLAYGSAKLLSWRRAILLAALSYVSIIGFVQLMSRLERSGAKGEVQLIAFIGGITMLCSWGALLYRIGRRVGYWSPAAQRSWRRAGWMAGILLCLGCVVILLNRLVSVDLQLL